MTYVETIKLRYDDLTKSEKKVADYVIGAGDKLINQTLTDVKKATGVGDATIVRFCQKLNYQGFSDLKIAIAKVAYKQDTAKESPDSYVDLVSNRLMDAIRSTSALVNVKDLNRGIELIHNAQRIFIFGVGSSGVTAMDMASRFLREGIQAEAITDSHYQAQNAALMNEHDLVIAFSLSGSTKDVFDSCKVAKQNGAKLIIVTNHLLSPIAKQGDVVLQTAVEELLMNGGSLSGKISQLCVCDLLITGYTITYHINSLKMRERVLRSIINKSMDYPFQEANFQFNGFFAI
ncbi:Sialic acid utilization regulator, RpiR family [Pediococcus damnosus]|uniref:Sialic acid utilization regulator, RpiR family n=1 Tax=Pediococcus damnosus TaxID=51663 RepID=A0A0R2HSI7_9LACO|nr:MurR/RpiR family transcriptional regulator [Pediococcus damnosus]AMV60671.1 Sialic acid utilization regulator, RpiR family [Pediococcus damnosus]AMV63264.1 Sialic acid utilization regulator, RpiR family [Pediococcus damnosus]AMV64985.1 Sialic acid utilization regulator, RpiR family [Pediococcus damnosus]AMV66840.1 Sialic acid utilization regulator, RpiR family [Pediococcus damnosus]AMV69794.1 Sialic acid utilization regulator, RpiR family [Pediococcus damnosus]